MHLRARRGRCRRDPGAHRRPPAGEPAGRERDDAPARDRGAHHHRRRDQPHTPGHRAGRAGGAPASPGRALPHRRARTVVGGGAPRGGQVGTRDERARREGHQPAARQPDHVPARQPDPGLGLRRGGVPAAGRGRRRRRLHRAADHRGAGVHARAARVPRGERPAAGTPGRASRRRHPTAPSPSRSTDATSASGRSPALASSSTRESATADGARRRRRAVRCHRLLRDHGRSRHHGPAVGRGDDDGLRPRRHDRRAARRAGRRVRDGSAT